MIDRILFMSLLMAVSLYVDAQITLEQCVSSAQKNYPLIRRYEILGQIEQINLSDINKSWLPQVSAYGQYAVQNAVPSLPEAMSGMLNRTGNEIKGLDKLQYKAAADISQAIWDGGTSKSRREIERALLTERQAALDIQIYAIREKVESLFFGILLMEEQIKQTELMKTLLESNLDRLRSMKSNGTAMQSDVDMVEARLLATRQQLIAAKSNTMVYRRMLNILTGTDIASQTLVRPEPVMPDNLLPNRPEQRHFEAQIEYNEAQIGNIRSAVMPKISLFAQAYYGYPGFDYFKSMMNRKLSFNILAGVRVAWNISALYTKKNSERKLRLLSDGVSADRDAFLLNTSLQTETHTARVSELRDIMKEDSRIVELRANVRHAAESQLENGVIDAVALLTKITDENQARLTAAYHEIQLIQSIYQLKNTLNR